MSAKFRGPVSPWKICGTAAGFALLAAGAFILYRYYPHWRRFFPQCPFFRLLHLYCPGCGSTRAVYHLLHGDLAGCFCCNPILLPSLVFAASLVIMPERAGKPIIVNTYIVVLVLFWILRNLPWHPFTLLAPPAGF